VLIRWFIFFILALVVSEVFIRYVFGLGDPPLYKTDAAYEYALSSNQNLIRFGNKFSTNSFGMRSSNINPEQDEILLLVGDSVVNGGALLDQSETMSTITEQRFSALYKYRKVRVASISAGSWGPQNQIAFLEQLPELNIIGVVLVFSSHDDSDIPTFRYSDTLVPQSRPVLALEEVVRKYLPALLVRVIKFVRNGEEPIKTRKSHKNGGEIRKIVSAIERYSVPILIYHHLTLQEISSESPRFNDEHISDVKYFDYQVSEDSESKLYYIDNIHPSPLGAKLMGEQIFNDFIEVFP
jgi:hypothetical protein